MALSDFWMFLIGDFRKSIQVDIIKRIKKMHMLNYFIELKTVSGL